MHLGPHIPSCCLEGVGVAQEEAPSLSLGLCPPISFAGRSRSPRGPSSWRHGAITEPFSYSHICHITSFMYGWGKKK